ncbi:unnamed protein product [Nezara viridula]|uniref:Uncharacterized protein n=1 Tax=Nezara viridula TaxID=85310 RepID=A0A9P0E594_NEZVI|nr:unnamed protein product [Nezara viridula]
MLIARCDSAVTPQLWTRDERSPVTSTHPEPEEAADLSPLPLHRPVIPSSHCWSLQSNYQMLPEERKGGGMKGEGAESCKSHWIGLCFRRSRDKTLNPNARTCTTDPLRGRRVALMAPCGD